MVATTGNAGIVDFVLGKQEVPASELTPEAWIKIIRATINDLPLKWARGFKPPKALLAKREGIGPSRLVDAEVIRRAVERGMRPNAVFLEIADIRSTVPSSWDCAPFEKVKNPIAAEGFEALEFEEHILLPVETIKLVVSRDGKLYTLHVSWKPREEWDATSMSSYPSKFWYEAEDVVLSEIGDDALIPLLKSAQGDDINVIECRILWSLYRILSETRSHLSLLESDLGRLETRVYERIRRIGR